MIIGEEILGHTIFMIKVLIFNLKKGQDGVMVRLDLFFVDKNVIVYYVRLDSSIVE